MEKEEGSSDGVEAVAEGRRVRVCERSSSPAGPSLGASCVCVRGCLHGCVCAYACECVCVHWWGAEEEESSAKPFEIYSAESSPISQVQTVNLNHLLTLCYRICPSF